MYRYTGSLVVVLAAFSITATAQGPPDIVWSFEGHTRSVRGVAFSPDGQFVVSGADYSDCRAISWAAEDGTQLQTFDQYPDGVMSVDISPAAPHLIVGYIVNGYPPGGVCSLWDMTSEEVLHTFGGCYVEFSPDGAYVASGGGGANRYVYVSRVSDGWQRQSWYHGSYILDVAYSPNGDVVASAGTNNVIKLWDPDSGDLQHTLAGHTDDVNAVAFSPDGAILASGAGGWDDPGEATIKLWRVSDGELLDTLPGHDNGVKCLTFTPDGSYLVSGGDGTIKIWRMSDGELERYYDENVNEIAFSPSGDRFFYGTPFRIVAMANWELESADVASRELAPGSTMLELPRPNPLASASTVVFALPNDSPVQLTVHDAAGRRVSTLVDRFMSAGQHQLTWDGRNRQGSRVAPGVYFVRLSTERGLEARKITVLE